jgi:hypothetical protein
MMDDLDDEPPTLVDIGITSKRIPVSILTGFLGSGEFSFFRYTISQNF